MKTTHIYLLFIFFFLGKGYKIVGQEVFDLDEATSIISGACNTEKLEFENVYFDTTNVINYTPSIGERVYTNIERSILLNGLDKYFRYQKNITGTWYQLKISTKGNIDEVIICDEFNNNTSQVGTIITGGCNSLETSTELVYFNTELRDSYVPKDGDIVYTNSELLSKFNGGNNFFRFEHAKLNNLVYEFEIDTNGVLSQVNICEESSVEETDFSTPSLETLESLSGGSFRPEYTKKYIISGWVKENNTNNEQVPTYENSAIRLYTVAILGGALEDPIHIGDFTPKGNIIDGWQRIEAVFTITRPEAGELTPNNLIIDLLNTDETSTITSYFDDVRIFPFNGSMKSFVYDNTTKKLMAELDENNYATFYEYDKEGGLVRVKKETTKGVFTIQETRSSNAKR